MHEPSIEPLRTACSNVLTEDSPDFNPGRFHLSQSAFFVGLRHARFNRRPPHDHGEDQEHTTRPRGVMQVMGVLRKVSEKGW
ncbi:hypothetical protein N7512_002150 [Penicillium capsulatum]|nr:hypothetical protein N7512_002150 [Penicillium capsulatum]